MKHVLYLLLVCFVFFGPLFAVETNQIESLRSRAQTSTQSLSSSDKDIIVSFWQDGLDELLLSDNAQDALIVRQQLARYRGKEQLSNYSAAYIAEGLKDIQSAFLNVRRLENPQQRTMVRRNLMILTAELGNPQMSPVALEHLNDEDQVVQYWAVKAITQPSVIQGLSSDLLGNDQIKTAILNSLSKLTSNETRPELLEMACTFCTALNDQEARQILLTICDRRIEAYHAWQPVQTELEIRLLRGLGSIVAIEQNAELKTTFAQKFSVLYALIVQRLMKSWDGLSDSEKNSLRTVIAEIDQNIVQKIMEIRTGILQALKTNNMNALKREYEILFGDRMRQGALAARYKFDYGKNNGKAITSPPELKPMPRTTVQN